MSDVPVSPASPPDRVPCMVEALMKERSDLNEALRNLLTLRWAITGGLLFIYFEAMKYALNNLHSATEARWILAFLTAASIAIGLVAASTYFEVIYTVNTYSRALTGRAIAQLTGRELFPSDFRLVELKLPGHEKTPPSPTWFPPWLQAAGGTVVIGTPLALLYQRLTEEPFIFCAVRGAVIGGLIVAGSLVVYFRQRATIQEFLKTDWGNFSAKS